ncbi:MAG: hypothetical protein ACK56G_15205 [Pirellulaceae bacterium]
MIRSTGVALAEFASSADPAAFENLLQSHEGLIVAAARRGCGSRRWEALGDDALAGARAGFWMACQQYNPLEHRWPLLAFSMARAEARRAVRQIVQRESNASHLPEPAVVPDSTPMALLDGLSPMDSAIARKLADGLSQREVAKQMGLGRQQVRGAIQRIREQLIDSDE